MKTSSLRINFLIIILFLAISSFCYGDSLTADRQTKNSIVTKDSVEIDLVVSLEKYACPGKCPVYQLKVYNDGKVSFSGKAFVQNRGEYLTFVNKEKIVDLLIMAEEFGLIMMQNEYPVSGRRVMNEFPLTILHLNLDGQEKRILYRHDTPVAIQKFERYFKDHFFELKWEKMDN